MKNKYKESSFVGKIDNFENNEYNFLSNFHPTKIEYENMIFNSVEAAFQAAKTKSLRERTEFLNLNPSEAKRLGRRIKLRDDWEEVKVGIMKELEDLAEDLGNDEAKKANTLLEAFSNLVYETTCFDEDEDDDEDD
jgi:predicted NAD-dependent protein-ADP-ribosyltransferase YbiA (DUF1768 family)